MDEKPRSRWTDGRATFTMDASRITMNWAAHTSARTIRARPVRCPADRGAVLVMTLSMTASHGPGGGPGQGRGAVARQQAGRDLDQPPSLVPRRFQGRGIQAVPVLRSGGRRAVGVAAAA